MAALLTSVGDIFTAAIGWVSDVATTITNTPILLLSSCCLLSSCVVCFIVFWAMTNVPERSFFEYFYGCKMKRNVG